MRIELVSVQATPAYQSAIHQAILHACKYIKENVVQIELINFASRAGGIQSPVPIQVIGNVKKTIIT
jgi:hypothetical protein